MTGAWTAGNNGTGKRIWFVTREADTGQEWLFDKAGRLRRFASYEAAQRVADRMNR